MPGPRRLKATKLGVIIGQDISAENLQDMFALLDKLYIKYEVIFNKTEAEFADYASVAKKRGLEAVIVAAKNSDNLPAACTKHCLVPLIFAPFSAKTKAVPAKLLARLPFATVAVDCPVFAAVYAARIIAIRDKSLARRMLSIHF